MTDLFDVLGQINQDLQSLMIDAIKKFGQDFDCGQRSEYSACVSATPFYST